MKGPFSLEWYLLLCQLNLKPFLITRFIQSRPQYLVNIMNSTNNIINVLS